jgi:glucokinase
MLKSYLDGPIALGFDIGGSKTKIGLVNQKGEILSYTDFPSNLIGRSIDDFTVELLGEIHKCLDMVDGNVIGIGATFLGWINEARTGPFLCLNAPMLHGLNLKNLLETEFHLPVVVNDDANAHLLAEYTYGSGRGIRRFMTIAMGTGLGIAMLINGKPLTFTAGCIGDAGHIILRPGGLTCSSGCKGCGEALIGVAGIEQMAFEKYHHRKPAYEIIKGAREGDDPLAVEIIKEIGLLTGELLASVSHIFLPDRIALTGGTATAGNTLLTATKERFEELVGDYHRTFSKLSDGYYSGSEIVLGKLKGETGVIGAVVELFNPG